MSHKITPGLINPASIVIVGGSNNVQKPGGKVLKNILGGTFKGKLIVVNPREDEVQGVKSYAGVEDIPGAELAILAIPAKFCPWTVRILAETKNTKAFIVVSAGFSEENEEGKALEKELVDIVEQTGTSLIGPNCIGVMTPYYQGVFTLPIPKLSPSGVDFISGSGATAVFIMESGLPKGLEFASVFSVGNSAQIGVEEMLEYMDETFDPDSGTRNKILYIESINNPAKLLKHASSLIRKGCRIAAIKAGSSEEGSRAASSHTGAIASSDAAVDALFKKAGIIRCYGREEMSYMAGVFNYPEIKGNNFAIITHAGGPAVMLTDVLSEGGFSVPRIEGKAAEELQSLLFPGSSVANPVDILATGTAEQVKHCIEFCEERFDEIDGIVIIFGSSGLTEVFDVYDVIHEKIKTCRKPVFPVLPSVSTAGREVRAFLDKGHVNFPDEVLLGKCLVKVKKTPLPAEPAYFDKDLDVAMLREIIDSSDEGYLSEETAARLLDAAGIPRLESVICNDEEDLVEKASLCGYPVVLKIVGPLHKSDVGGVKLDIRSEDLLLEEFRRMSRIDGFQAVQIQPMLKGMELFLGASYEEGFGHLLMCGMGGIFVEVIRDVSAGLVPLNREEALEMITSLKSYPVIKSSRGQEGVDVDQFTGIILKLSGLLYNCPEIMEMDLNPLIGTRKMIKAVDMRIRISK